jgi:hypothetical protein
MFFDTLHPSRSPHKNEVRNYNTNPTNMFEQLPTSSRKMSTNIRTYGIVAFPLYLKMTFSNLRKRDHSHLIKKNKGKRIHSGGISHNDLWKSSKISEALVGEIDPCANNKNANCSTNENKQKRRFRKPKFTNKSLECHVEHWARELERFANGFHIRLKIRREKQVECRLRYLIHLLSPTFDVRLPPNVWKAVFY